MSLTPTTSTAKSQFGGGTTPSGGGQTLDHFKATSGLETSGKLKISPELTFDFTSEDLEDFGEIGRGAYGTVNKSELVLIIF